MTEVRRPAKYAPIGSPIASGNKCNAALSAPAPVTLWKRNGTSTVREIAWKLVKNTVHQHSTASRLANRCIGNNGSCARRSCQANTPSAAPAQPSNPSTSRLCQA
ncbi:hypothetical protein D3C84_952160 [compost metagenome]